MLQNNIRRSSRKRRIKIKITSVKNRPRLVVFRSNKHIYCQIVDNSNGKIIASANDIELKNRSKNVDNSLEVGKIIADRALKANVKNVVFDRSGYKYHGRVKSLADGARNQGLVF